MVLWYYNRKPPLSQNPLITCFYWLRTAGEKGQARPVLQRRAPAPAIELAQPIHNPCTPDMEVLVTLPLNPPAAHRQTLQLTLRRPALGNLRFGG